MFKIYIFIILLGLAVGSFLNVCIYTIPRKQSIIYPPSYCTKCGHKLSIFDLIPVISYVSSKGKCKYCNSKISVMYPLIEITNSLLYLILFIKFGISLNFLSYCFLISLLLAVFVIDLYYRIIPNKINLFGFTIILTIKILESIYKLSFSPLTDGIFGLLIGSIPLSLVILASKGGMGAGDIKLAAVIGMCVGLKFIYMILVISIFVASIIAFLILITKKGTRKSEIPFAPFLFISTFICLLFGQNIFNFIFLRGWYL